MMKYFVESSGPPRSRTLAEVGFQSVTDEQRGWWSILLNSCRPCAK